MSAIYQVIVLYKADISCQEIQSHILFVICSYVSIVDYTIDILDIYILIYILDIYKVNIRHSICFISK